MMSTMRKSSRTCIQVFDSQLALMNHRMQYTQSSEQCYTGGNTLKVQNKFFGLFSVKFC